MARTWTSLLLGVALIQMGCEQRFKKEGEDEGQPRLLGIVADPACTADSALDDLGVQTIWRWRNGRLADENYDFSGFSGKTSLSGPGLEPAVRGISMEFTQRCTESSSGGASCTGAGGRIYPSRIGIPICRSDIIYPRDSVEGAALTATASLNDAAHFHTELGGTLEPVTLSVFPYVRDLLEIHRLNGETQNLEEQRVDNAFWMATRQGNSYISILPSSEAFQEANPSGPNFWEVPFVVVHEYGHHVFAQAARSLTTGTFSATGEITTVGGVIAPQWRIVKTLPPVTPKPGRPGSGASGGGTLGGRAVTENEVLGALNEAFADAFAFLAAGAAPGQTKGVPCMGNDRDPASPMLLGGHMPRLKLLDDQALDEFFSSVAQAGVATNNPICPAFNMQDIHILGAIVAYGFQFVAGDEVPVLERGRILMNWARSLGLVRQEGLSPRAFLKASMQAYLERLAERQNGSRLNPDQCGRARLMFPEAATHAFGNRIGCTW